MSRIIEFGRRIFGNETPRHNFRVEKSGSMVKVDVEIEQPEGAVAVRYTPGTQICFESEGFKYRNFGDDEVIFASEIHFLGMGMSNGKTVKDDYFKAMDDPLEVTPLEDITPKKAK